MNKQEVLIVKDKKFLVERKDYGEKELKIGGIVVVNNQKDFSGMEDLYKLISKETGLDTDYIFKIFLKSYRKFLDSDNFDNLTEAVNAGFETDGFKNWEEG